MKKSIGIGGGVGLAIACCAIIVGGQNQKQNEDAKGDLARLTKAPVVPQMLVDSDGTLHFGLRTVPPPALESAEARQSYARQMFARAQTSAAHGGSVAVRTIEGHAPPIATGRSKDTALKIYPVLEESQKIGGVGVTIYSPRSIPPKNRKQGPHGIRDGRRSDRRGQPGQFKVIKVNWHQRNSDRPLLSRRPPCSSG